MYFLFNHKGLRQNDKFGKIHGIENQHNHFIIFKRYENKTSTSRSIAKRTSGIFQRVEELKTSWRYKRAIHFLSYFHHLKVTSCLRHFLVYRLSQPNVSPLLLLSSQISSVSVESVKFIGLLKIHLWYIVFQFWKSKGSHLSTMALWSSSDDRNVSRKLFFWYLSVTLCYLNKKVLYAKPSSTIL